jgi:hypothetical protein
MRLLILDAEENFVGFYNEIWSLVSDLKTFSKPLENYKVRLFGDCTSLSEFAIPSDLLMSSDILPAENPSSTPQVVEKIVEKVVVKTQTIVRRDPLDDEMWSKFVEFHSKIPAIGRIKFGSQLKELDNLLQRARDAGRI